LTLALGVIAVRRYDPAVALAVAAAVAALAARRPALSGAALGLAVALKGVPILLAPIFVMYAVAGRSRPRAGDDGASGRTPVFRWAADRAVLRRWLAGLVATLVPTGLAYALIAGPHALDAVAYHGTRPIQIETIYSGLLILAHGFDPGLLTKAFAFGSLNAVSSAEPFLRNLSTALTLAGIAASWVFAWARLSAARDEADRLIAVLEASLGCLIAFITLGKVFSPQYCVWLVPLAAALAPFAPDAARRRLRVAFLFVQAEWPFLYALLYTTLIPAAGALIAMRTAWLWGYVGALVAGPRAQGSPVRAASAPPPSDRPLPSSRA
ncbi:MAG TPA: hypothetical protein VEH77_15910, partial [Roseiarcus sp.]|nr:hypothetical protein [Roseiarcus sp.]